MPTEQRPSSKTRTVLLYSEENVRRAEAVFLHLGFCLLLLCPIIGLSYLESKMWKLVLLGIFLFVASLLFVGLVNVPNKSGLALVAGYVVTQVSIFLQQTLDMANQADFYIIGMLRYWSYFYLVIVALDAWILEDVANRQLVINFYREVPQKRMQIQYECTLMQLESSQEYTSDSSYVNYPCISQNKY